MNGYESRKPTISTIRATSRPAIGSRCPRSRIQMELATLANTYGDFYAPSYAVRIGTDDLMRDLLVAVSQVEVDLVLGAASRFTFTVSDSYSHKLHAFKTGRGADVLKLLTFGTEVE